MDVKLIVFGGGLARGSCQRKIDGDGWKSNLWWSLEVKLMVVVGGQTDDGTLLGAFLEVVFGGKLMVVPGSQTDGGLWKSS